MTGSCCAWEGQGSSEPGLCAWFVAGMCPRCSRLCKQQAPTRVDAPLVVCFRDAVPGQMAKHVLPPGQSVSIALCTRNPRLLDGAACEESCSPVRQLLELSAGVTQAPCQRP